MKILFVDREVSTVGSCVVTVNAAKFLAIKHTVLLAGMFRSQGHPSLGRIQLLLPSKGMQKIFKKNKFILTFFGPLALLFLLIKHAWRVDIIVPGSTPTHWLAVIVGKLYGKKVIWNCFEPWIAFEKKDIPQVGLSAYIAGIIGQSPVDRFFVKFIDRIFTLDEKNKKRVKKLYERNATVIRPGVDFTFFSKGSKKKAKKLWRIPKGFTLVCTGALTPMKNQTILIQAVAQLTKTIPNIRLVLVGGGPLRQQLEEEVKKLGLQKHIFFLGTIKTNELPHIFALADLLLFPAFHQTWGLTPFEAACVGTPCIVSLDAGSSEVINKADIGWIANPIEKEFRRKIQYVFSHPMHRLRMGEKARKYVKYHMTWKEYATNIEKFLTT